MAEQPKLHSGEDTRWDFRVTSTFKYDKVAFDPDLKALYKKQIYPDREKLKRDERHRFELLISLRDVMTEKIKL